MYPERSLSLVVWWLALLAQSPLWAAGEVRILAIEGPAGSVEVRSAGANDWKAAMAQQVLVPGDRIRTLEKGRALLRWWNLTTVPLPPFTDLIVEPAPDGKQPGFNLVRGLLYFFHRDRPTDARFRTRSAAAAIRGTEFVIEYLEAEDRTVVTVLDGQVVLSNDQDAIQLVSGEQGIAEPGARPHKTPVIEAINIIQWFLYYPGVLDVDELGLLEPAESLAAYRSGDLLGALAAYPANRTPASPQETIYLAALWLSVGRVETSEGLLNKVPEQPAAVRALRKVIASAKRQPVPFTQPSTATEWLAESYYQQSLAQLPEALRAARNAVQQSPEFGLAWARVGEMEFSFGHTHAAEDALAKALELAPRNAQAHALRGFVFAARGEFAGALDAFDHAIELDAGLGNAWLGRGLVKIRQGKIEEGRDDIQTAVAAEPQRALFRSYLAKSFSAANDNAHARRELIIAKSKDAKDPTAWFYSALLNQQENRINEAIEDLEYSQALNDNRAVYRSGLLLDQDEALRGANLASIYGDAGMFDVSVREAARAVNIDPANYSAHLFLANSYYEAFDPRHYNQRYEAARVNEYLTATLLAPVGAGVLSPAVSAQEYSRLFERDGLGLYSSTEYLSRGAWQQYAAQYGRFGDLSYSLDGYYRSDPGQRPNNDLEQLYGSVQSKVQLTQSDAAYVQAVWLKAKFGDLSQVYDPETQGDPEVRGEEIQEPLLLLGYHHEWSPGNHSLFLAGSFQDRLRFDDPSQSTLVLSHLDPVTLNHLTQITNVSAANAAQAYRSELEIYSAEAQQVLQRERYALIGGARYQTGEFNTRNRQTDLSHPFFVPEWFDNSRQDFDSALQRASVYGYAHWQMFNPLRLIGGVSYDYLVYPENFRIAPIANDEESKSQVLPKAGLIYTPLKNTTVRAAYSRSLGGVSFDQSFQLEPSQVAGFNQAWRSIIPESVAGATSAAEFETWNLSFEQKFPSRTYFGLGGEILRSDVERTVGAFETTPPQIGVFPLPPFVVPSGTRQVLDYEERAVLLTVNQLLGEGVSLGARYRLSEAELETRFPDIPQTAVLEGGFRRQREETATLHQLLLYAIYNHPTGLFGQTDAVWLRQSNAGYGDALPGDDFWQLNLFVGLRFPKRHGELRLGILNVTDQDYRLNPLSLVSELPRERTFVAALRFSF